MAGHLLGAMVVFTSAVVPNIFLMSPTLPAESVVTFLGGSLSSSLSPHTLGGTMWGGFCCRKTGKGSCGAWVVVGGEMLAILGVSLGGLQFWWWVVLVVVVCSCLVVVGGTMVGSGLIGGTCLWVFLGVVVLAVLVVVVAACLTGMIVIFFFVFGFSFFLQLFTFFSFSNLLLILANFDMKISFSFFFSWGKGVVGFGCFG